MDQHASEALRDSDLNSLHFLYGIKMRTAIFLAIFFIFGLTASHASEPEETSPEHFSEIAVLPMGTMRYSEFLGISEGKAYIALHEMSTLGQKEWSTKIYWVEASRVDKNLLGSLKPAKQ